ncbi:NADP-dependent oxidoreductase [Streptacidiphilus anmyonensis]|uniref:NADP-dependent oxidoreductase n=1 Tax=Streptacidiphilus anmyonensis TaxID=405782 RepID=UPI0005A81778|nr:NADP-dependent oxidoreductase [Streptacidiphilus anmyonensis]
MSITAKNTVNAPSATATASPVNRLVHQVARPRGAARAEDFAFVSEPLPRVVAGTALVENLYLSVDPYMREMMDDGWALHAPLEGRSVGRVVESGTPELAVGDLVFHRHAWRTHALVRPEEARLLPRYEGVPLTAHLGILGGTGLSAWVGLTRVARLQPGEDLFVSAAAGGVGTAAGRLARHLGARRIVGSTGSPEKARRLTEELGFDAAFDYHQGQVADLLAKAAPDGVDVAFENVGGDHLEGAIAALRPHGRIAWCGAVAQYDRADQPPAAPRNLYDVVGKGLRLEGFLVREHLDARSELEDFAVPLLRSGALVSTETVVDGFDRIVEGFLGMMHGANTGKTIVRVVPEAA